MNIDASVLTALGSWALVLCALYAVWRQTKVTRDTTSVQLFLNVSNQYQLPEMRRLRGKFAKSLLSSKNKEDMDESVLEFFETLAHLTRRGMLERQMVWNTFSIESRIYWFAAEPYVRTLRGKYNDPTLYEELEWLNRTMVKMETARRHKTEAEVQVTPDQRDDFLRSEANMPTANEEESQPAPAHGRANPRR